MSIRTVSSEIGLAYNRRLTKRYIDHDPTTLVLTPHARSATGDGGYSLGPGTPKAPQKFKLVAVINNWDGITRGEYADSRSWAYIVVGEYDADIAIGDTWNDGNTTYRITAILQASDYEIRCAATAFGEDPNYG